MSDPEQHWQAAYESKAVTDVSWYEPVPRHSLELIDTAGLSRDAALIDIGGGASTLVDNLLASGFVDLTVLDLAAASLDAARIRLGAKGESVDWIVADVTAWRPSRRYKLWHDRAVFHFLIDTTARDAYLATLRATLAPGGYVVMATFGPDGPTRCSGLDTQRYSPDGLNSVLGSKFRPVVSHVYDHVTPGGGVQQFLYGLWQSEA